MSKSLNITSNILFLGHLNHQEINYHYTKSTCVISASVWQESLGLALIEAQSVGVPVIASDAGGVRDIIIDNYTGMLFPVGNWRRLSECMAKIALNPALGVRLGVAGRQHVLDHFSKAEGISRLLDLYQFEVTHELSVVLAAHFCLLCSIIGINWLYIFDTN